MENVKKGIAVAGSVIGILGMFFASWLGAFGPANAALAALVMLLWLIPNAVIGDTLKAAKSGNFWPSFKNSNILS